MIVEKQQGDTWGKSVVGNLADDLRKEFPGTNGFSAANLWRMKNFYEVYGPDAKLAPACARNRLVPQHHHFGEVQERAGAGVLHP